MLATRIVQSVQPLGADGPALARLLQQAGLGKSAVLRVTGPAGLTAALWLCRHGFEHAAYVHPNWVGTMRSADALVVPHACASEELGRLLQDGDCLREGGVLIVQTATDAPANGVDAVSLLLEALGYRLEHRLSDKGRAICVARRLGAPGYSKAA
ncbi:MAG: hypothetical protein P4L73_16670 [Caulobacteraceae bacterium]|nr:hypothetical protein [Caulobacteraceae bacterium]